MKNEKGFIFPFTLMVTFLAFFVIISSVHIYLSESRYIHETEGYYIQNSMIAIGLKHILEQIESKSMINQGKMSFAEGEVSYTIQQLDTDRYQILLITKNSLGQQTKNEVVYNHERKKITKWVEN